MKRILSLMIIVICLVLCILSATSFTLQYSRTYQSADSSGAYRISFSGNHADISRYTSDAISVGLNLSYKISGVCAYQGKAVFFCDDTANNQLIVYLYYLDTDVLDSFAIYGAKLYGDTDFCCGDNAVYIENHRDSCELNAYSFSGNPVGRYRLDQRITSLCNGYDSGVYAVSDNTLYRLSGDRFTAVTGEEASPPLFPASAEILVSDYGQVYVINGNRIARSFSVDGRFGAGSACVIGNRLYHPCGSVINGYDIESGEKVSSCRLSFEASLLYSDTGSMIAVGSNTYTAVNLGDFIELNRSDDSAEHGGRNDSSGGYHSGNGNNTDDAELYAISSDIYTVDLGHYCISGISPETTISQFKNNMRYNGWTVALYRDGIQKTSGNIGTAMTAVFSSDSGSITFELSVSGDLTGEGNCNSRDANTLLDYLIGTADFNGVYLLSADLSGDGAVDAVDAALLQRIR
ncbi:MAG: dockerin type I repeat-containing protein [Ruminococcus sp.]|nr:dockerin type I repeat-containing protein [Ruminococcus sp.]